MNLKTYLKTSDTTVAEFAEKLGVTVQSLYRYINGDRVPKKKIMKRISLITNGHVMPNSFYEVHLDK